MKTKSKNKKSIRTILRIIAILAGIYFVGVIIFSFRMMPNSYMENFFNKYDLSWNGENELQQIIDMNDSCKFVLTLPDNMLREITLKDIKDITVSQKSGKDIVQSQKKFEWPLQLPLTKNLEYDISYPVDRNKLKKELDKLDVFDGEESKDAYLAISENNEIYIEEEVYGTQIDEKKLLDEITMQLKLAKTSLKTDESYYIKPKITKDSQELKQQYEKIKKKIDREITVDLKGMTEIINTSRFYNKEKILTENIFEEDDEKIEEYLDYLEKNYNTFNIQRNFINHANKKIKVGGAGDIAGETYGFLLNREKTKVEILNVLHHPELTEMEVIWDMEGYKWGEMNDIGDTYVELSIDEQKLWYFQDGKKVFETNVITGLPTANRHTPKGLYSMFWKDTNTKLTGELDGESWNVTVDYWLSVTYTGIGIHSAPWQWNFGGDTYTYNGSHGCINVSTEDAAYLYNNVEIGTPIVIY